MKVERFMWGKSSLGDSRNLSFVKLFYLSLDATAQNSLTICDDEDNCIEGSASGDGPGYPETTRLDNGPNSNGPGDSDSGGGKVVSDNDELWYPGGTDSELCSSCKFIILHSILP